MKVQKHLHRFIGNTFAAINLWGRSKLESKVLIDVVRVAFFGSDEMSKRAFKTNLSDSVGRLPLNHIISCLPQRFPHLPV